MTKNTYFTIVNLVKCVFLIFKVCDSLQIINCVIKYIVRMLVMKNLFYGREDKDEGTICDKGKGS